MESEPSTPAASLARHASDLPALLAALKGHVSTIRELTSSLPQSIVPELNIIIDESLSDAQTLIKVVAQQQQLTKVDPLDPSAKTGLSPTSEDDYDEFDEELSGEPDAPLSEEAKQMLLSVFAAYDSLNGKQVLCESGDTARQY